MNLQFYNTHTRLIEPFTPADGDTATLYTCGPTVYDYPHVGNWTSFIYWDILVRTVLAAGFSVNRVMNITDVGHLVSDADEGEDKLEKGAAREGKTAWEVAEFYAEDFVQGMEKLGMIPPEHLVKATEFIPQQLDLVRILKEKGYTYQTTDGIYFDTSKFPTYADFAHLDLAAQKAGARVEDNPEKRQPWDFALWKFTPVGQTRDMEWETPEDLLELGNSGFGVRSSGKNKGEVSEAHLSTRHLQPESSADTYSTEARSEAVLGGDEGSEESLSPVMGFPGWHLECSAMAMSILGPTIDIHTGGIDHIPVHHTNEIAQSEAASGQLFSHMWIHNNHLKIEGGKISKSLGNGYTLQDLAERGFDPMDLRMFILQSHYSSEGNFTWENLTAARNRRLNWLDAAVLRHQTHDRLDDDQRHLVADNHLAFHADISALKSALADNLDTPAALRIVDEALSRLDTTPLDRVHHASLTELIRTIDELLGLGIEAASPDIDDTLKQRIIERQRARDSKNWEASDHIREQLLAKGIVVKDMASSSVWAYARS
jgi:cysteinyl-tRNA synthetase